MTLLRILLLLLPIAAMVATFYSGLGAWYQQDDFAHLNLAAATALAELPALLVRPIAQGTFRPLSERGFYWVLWHWFGLDAQPGHIFCFVLQAVNSVLLGALLRRMTGSVWAALAGSIAWVVQPCLALPMTWVATTNQVMWAGLALGTVYCFARYCEGEDWRWLAGAWGCYLVGFGVLESNVAVAGLVVLYAWLRARRRIRTALVFVAPAVLFAALHFLLIPKRGGGAYGVRLDAGMLVAAWTYWGMLWRGWGLIAAAVCAWLVWRKESRAVALFALGWFVFALAPVLPLQGHLTDYYLTVPAVAVALLFAGLWQSEWRAGAVLLAGYLVVMVPAAWRAAEQQVEKSLDMQALVLGVGQAQKLNPGKTVLLDGIGDGVFWSGVYDNPFRLAGAPNTKLTPQAGAKLTPYPELFQAANYVAPVTGDTAIYRFENRRLSRVTDSYSAAPPSRIALSLPTQASFLGPEWHSPEDGYRWMPGKATAMLEGVGGELRLEGLCVSEQAKLEVAAAWEDQPIGTQAIAGCPKDFAVSFALPKERGKRGKVTFTAQPTFHAGADQRDLALAVRSIEIR